MSTAPVITIFVRHSADCRYTGDEFYKRCNCRKHLRWTHNGKQYRKKAGARSWTEAEKIKRNLEAQYEGKPATAEQEQQTVERAIELFLASKRAQGIGAQVIKKYDRELQRLNRFHALQSKLFVSEITLAGLTEYRAEWDTLYPASATRQQVQTRLRGFLRYCYDARWLDRIPRLSAIKADSSQTLPLTPTEYQKLLDTIPKSFPDVVHVPKSDQMPAHTRASMTKNRAGRIHALIQLMRWSGLAIMDAVSLKRDELKQDMSKGVFRVVKQRQKRKRDDAGHVSVPIPTNVAKELLAVFNDNPKYFFWTGNGEPRTAVGHFQDDLRRLFQDAGIASDGFMVSHRFRDTFAVDLLEKGVPIEHVSKLLGHDSLRTTEKSYAKWSKGRQELLDSVVIASWKIKKKH